MADSFRSSADVNARLHGGISLLQSGRMEEAWNVFAGILQADPNHFVAHHLIGLIYLQTGQFEAGIASLKTSIALNPRDPVAHSNLGNGLRDMGAREEALASYNRALSMAPDFVDAYNNRGVLLRAMERNAEALADYDRALSLNPGLAHLHSNWADALRALGRNDEALAGYDRAIALAPGHPGGHYNRANLLADSRRRDEAVAGYDRALAIRPDYVEAWMNRGNVLLDMNRREDALASYDRAIALQSDLAQAHSNRGGALRALDRHAEAVDSADRALAIDPAHAEAHATRANALLGLGRSEEALESYTQAIAIQPGLAPVYSNRGNALCRLGRHAEALDNCDRAIALDPAYPDPLINRAMVLQELGRYPEALADYDRALRLDPDRPEARWANGCTHLTVGDFAKGWEAYEWRWKVEGSARFLVDRGFPQPLWLGRTSLADKTILLHSEQGLGDSLQFCRYARLVKDLGATVLLEAEEPLVGILSTLDGPDRVIVKGAPLPGFDLHCPLMSLPLAMGTELSTIPADIPYLRADPDKARAWADRLGRKTRLRVGLVWSGGHRTDQPELWPLHTRRNITLSRLALLNNPHIEFHSLQKGEPARGELSALVAAGWDGPPIRDHADALEDFTDTAALIENLDLVIAVDTSTAHLAGALGKPVWILNRFDTCWRWMLERTDSPWYPTARLFRQTAFNDWGPVLDELKTALDALSCA